MFKYLNIKNINKRYLNINYFLLYIFILLIKSRIIFCNSCKENNIITNTECFNNIIIFNDKSYRAGNFAKNKNGDMIVEYSSDSSRLFYGLKKDKTYYFSGESHTKVIGNIDNDEGVTARYESKNLFVSLEDDINKNTEYLFSVSSYISLTELHDLENNEYIVRKTENFIGNKIFSYQFQLLEAQIDNKNIYFCLYTNGTNDEGTNYSIKKFGFTSFELNSYDDITTFIYI